MRRWSSDSSGYVYKTSRNGETYMDNDNRRAAYPCDEIEERQNPLHSSKEAVSYRDNKIAKNGNNTGDGDTGDEDQPRKGKGRRGGNSKASLVVHSGNFRKRPQSGSSDEEHRGFAHAHSDYRRRDNDDRDYGRDRREYRRHDDRYSSDRPGRGNRDRGERGRNPEAVLDRAYSVTVTKTSEVGAFVSVPEDIRDSIYGRKLPESNTVLLPFSEQLGRPIAGESIRVYFYEDKGGRITATMRTPILRDGEVGILTVADVTSIGAFLDNGVPKQVLLPFKEQIVAPKVGDEVLVWLYSDKSGRQAATMRVYGHLDKHSPYKEDDRVTGFVYEINPRLGIFVAVDNRYYGLVPMAETFKEYAYGDEIEARVAKVREDGKLDLLIRDKLYKTVDEDAEVILYELKRNNGFLPYGDRADAAFIEETYAMSKNQFKRALGHLYRNRIVELDREKDTVRLIKD